MKKSKKQEQVFQWCVDHDDLLFVRGYLGAIDTIIALDRPGQPQELFQHAVKIRDHFYLIIAQFMGKE